MVQFLLRSGLIVALLAPSALWARSKAKLPAPADARYLEMDGGRRLSFERSFQSEREVKTKRGFWTKLIDLAAGAPDYKNLVRPYSLATDSHGRLIVTDPGMSGIHIFDFAQQKYKFITHPNGKDELREPMCVAVDQQDRIYVTDAVAGKIFVFTPGGKFERVIGSLRGGEGYFKRPTGIAVDSEAQRIFVSDTWRDKIFVLDMQGAVLQTIGKRGEQNGEFNLPTELRLDGQDLIVVDAMNFRIQVLDRAGNFRFAIGRPGQAGGDLYRPKGLALDSEGHIYVADAFYDIVQVFDREGHLLYYFGKAAGVGDFRLPAGLTIDRSNRIYVVDTSHRRVQVFQYQAGGAK
jgi:DNA-binding beta-propeller fold protein YncE